MNGGEPTGPEGTVAPAPVAPPNTEGASRVLLIVLGIIAFVLVLGAVVYFALGALGVSLLNSAITGTPATVTPGITSVPTTASAAASTATVLPIPDVSDADVFTPRDPFVPIVPEVEASTSTSSSSSSSSASTDTSGTLILQDIVTENGVRKAVVRLDGVTYTLAAGKQVGSSSWSIVTVNSSSVVVLYGDEQVTITLGQGSSK
jgi:hypothetical protein